MNENDPQHCKNEISDFRNIFCQWKKQVYEETGKNYSWNMYGPGGVSFDTVPNTKPHYFDNPYWMRHNTYNTDARNRYFGNINLNYEVMGLLNEHTPQSVIFLPKEQQKISVS